MGMARRGRGARPLCVAAPRSITANRYSPQRRPINPHRPRPAARASVQSAFYDVPPQGQIRPAPTCARPHRTLQIGPYSLPDSLVAQSVLASAFSRSQDPELILSGSTSAEPCYTIGIVWVPPKPCGANSGFVRFARRQTNSYTLRDMETRPIAEENPMPKHGIRPPVVYVYLDPVGIDSLFAQTVDEIVDEFRRVGERTTKLGTKLKAALAILFGIDLSSEAEFSHINKKAEETKSHLATEQKLDRVFDYLRQSEGSEYFTDLKTATEYCKDHFFDVNSVFVKINENFDAPQFYIENLVNRGVREVNMSGTVEFEKGPSLHEYSDDHFRKGDFRLVMLAGIDKFTRTRDGKMEAADHDAYMMRAGVDIRLNVFGYLRLRRIEYQIKPYAIWL